MGLDWDQEATDAERRSALGEISKQLFDYYSAMLGAGFSSDQAMELTRDWQQNQFDRHAETEHTEY